MFTGTLAPRRSRVCSDRGHDFADHAGLGRGFRAADTSAWNPYSAITASGVPGFPGHRYRHDFQQQFVHAVRQYIRRTTGVALANTNSLNSLNVTMTFTSDSGNSSLRHNIASRARPYVVRVVPRSSPSRRTRAASSISRLPQPISTVTGFRFTPSLSFTSLTPLE